MRRERHSRTACTNTAVGGEKRARCVREEGRRSPGGRSGRWGVRRRKEHLEVLIQWAAVVGHALIGLAVLVELALYIVRLL